MTRLSVRATLFGSKLTIDCSTPGLRVPAAQFARRACIFAMSSLTVAELTHESQSLERAGDIAAALRQAELALEHARAAGSPADVAAALNCVAFHHFRMGHYPRARALAEQALTHAPVDTPERVDALLMLGMCATETRDLSAGEDDYLRAIDLSRQLGYHRALVRGLHNLAAGVYMPRGQFELSLASNREALRLAQEHGINDLAWASRLTIAWVYWLTSRHAQAVEALDELHRLVLPGSSAESYYLCAVANLALDNGELDRVPPLFNRARSIAEVTGEPSINVLVRLGLSRYYRTVEEACAARAWADDALMLATRVEYCHLQGIALIERARATWQAGDRPAAEDDLRAAIINLSALGANFDLARARFFLAALLHEQASHQTDAAWRNAAQAILDGNYVFFLEQERALAFPLVAAYLNHADANLAAFSSALVARLDRVPPPPLQIAALGRFEVRRLNRLISDNAWRQRRAGVLFRFLLISRNRTRSRDAIIEALWREKPIDSTHALFHQATSALRRALEPELPDKFPSRYLQIEEGQVTLHLPPGSRVDIQSFEQHIQKEEWEAALEIYQGDLFPKDQYADWAVAPRERLRRQYLRALLIVAHRRSQAGKPREALDLCHRILETDPWQEDAVLIGMKACLAFNDRAGALRLHRELERTLREELGTEPQAALQDLYQSLL